MLELLASVLSSLAFWRGLYLGASKRRIGLKSSLNKRTMAKKSRAGRRRNSVLRPTFKAWRVWRSRFCRQLERYGEQRFAGVEPGRLRTMKRKLTRMVRRGTTILTPRTIWTPTTSRMPKMPNRTRNLLHARGWWAGSEHRSEAEDGVGLVRSTLDV